MKVNISYAVELEDVPAEVGKLLVNLASYMAVLLNDTEELGAANPTQAVDSISEIRQGLATLDLRLADCANILSGYMDVKTKIASGQDPSVSQPLEVESDE